MAVQAHQYLSIPSGRDPCHADISSDNYNYKIRLNNNDHLMTPLSVWHETEIDALIRVQREKMRTGVEEASKTHCREIISAMGRRIAQKQAELETARRIHSELESKMEEVAAQTRIWFDHARSTEASAFGLKAALDRLLRHVPPEDAGSACCHDDKNRQLRNPCRACRERDVSVLLLPCRHLCLCRECEPEVDACPICSAAKSGGLQVLMG